MNRPRPKDTKECAKCKGSGKIKDTSDYEKWAYPNGLPDVKCAECDGRGYTFINWKKR